MTKAQEKKLIEMRGKMSSPTISTEERFLINKDGSTTSPTTEGCNAHSCTLSSSEIQNASVIAHLHNNQGGTLGAKSREFPGPGDHVPVTNYSTPVAIYTPKGAIRVVELIGGKISVRTIYGGSNRNNLYVSKKWKAGMTSSQLSKIAGRIR